MKYGRIPGIGKPVSRLVMGVDNQRTMPHAAVSPLVVCKGLFPANY